MAPIWVPPTTIGNRHASGVACVAHARRNRHGIRIFRHALPSAREGAEGRSRLGPPDAALARRAGLRRGLDRRALHRAVGAASFARPADRPGAAADQAAAHRAGRFPAALPPSRRTRRPRGDAGSPVGRTAQFRRRRVGAADRLGDVPGGRHGRCQPRDDARVARHHPAAVERRTAVSPTRANSGRWRSPSRCSAS